jgi:hypothetical protein
MPTAQHTSSDPSEEMLTRIMTGSGSDHVFFSCGAYLGGACGTAVVIRQSLGRLSPEEGGVSPLGFNLAAFEFEAAERVFNKPVRALVPGAFL